MRLKGLLLGSAAALAAGGVQAADLPVAEPVEYVRICDAYGTGFFYIPGTETCLKIGGYVRAEAHLFSGLDDELVEVVDPVTGLGTGLFARNPFFVGPLDTRNYNQFTTRARADVSFDARTMTDYGLLRSFIEIAATFGPSDFGNYDSPNLGLFAAFVTLSNDFGVFTAGRAASFWNFYGTYAMATRGVGADDPNTEANLFAFTFAGGNGFSATISLEDPASAGKRVSLGGADAFDVLLGVDNDGDGVIDSVATGAASGEGIHGGNYTPDLVANVRVDQGFGSAQIMGVLHNIRPIASVTTTDPLTDGLVVLPLNDFGSVESEIGWAVGAGLTLKVPNTSFEATIQGMYGDGAIGYITTGNGAPRTDGIVQRVFVDANGDGIIDGVELADDIQTSEAWKISGGVKAGVTDALAVSLSGFYTSVDLYEDALEFGEPVTVGQVFTPRFGPGEYDSWGAALRADYTVVSGLAVSAEIAYERIEFDDDIRLFGTGVTTPAGGATVFADDIDDEQDRFGGQVRVQRNF